MSEDGYSDEEQDLLDRIAVLEEESRGFQMQCRSLRLASMRLERLLEAANTETKERMDKVKAFERIVAELSNPSPSIEKLKEIMAVYEDASI